MDYFVDPSFSLHQVDNVDYIQSKNFSAKIKNSGLKKFLTYLEKNNVSTLSEAKFSSIVQECDLNKKELLDFLIFQAGLFKTQVNKKTFQTLALFGEGEVIEQLCESFQGQFGLTVEHYSKNAVVETADTIIVHFSKILDSDYIKTLYQSSNDPNNYFITAYLMSDYLIIDNIYSKHSALPCHFCHIERLKQNASLIPRNQNRTWLAYYKEILRHNNTGIPAVRLSPVFSGYIVFCLYQFIRRLVDPFFPEWHYDQYIHFWHVHLEKMTIEKEAAIFWPFCSCAQEK